MNTLNDSKAKYRAKGIELQTIPSDKCEYGKCDGKGYLHWIDWEKKVDAIDNPEAYRNRQIEIEWTKECKCAAQRRNERKITNAGIPDKYKGASIESFDIDAYADPTNQHMAAVAKKASLRYVERFKDLRKQGKGLYFYSAIKGSGKTRLASSIANALIKVHECNVLFVKANNISLQVRKTYKKDSDVTEDDVLRVFRTVEVLVIDDLAVNDETGFSEGLLGKILDARMDSGMITIVTSNYTIEELKTLYPKGIVASRIGKLCYEILMPEESIRDEEAKSDNDSFESILFGE